MSKVKYYYDSETLSYRKIEKKKGRNITYVVMAILGSFLSGFILLLIFLNFPHVQTPKEKSMNRELENLKLQYGLLSRKMEQAEDVLREVEDRDNNIYRVYFEAAPIPESQRLAGFGGINRYKDLEGHDNSDLIIRANKQMDRLQKRIVVQSKSLDEIAKLAKNKEEFLAAMPAIQPIENKELRHMSSGFGRRWHPILKMWRMHNGMDFASNIGANIYATADGEIKRASWVSGYGQLVEIEHGFGYKTRYGHMSKILVKTGQKVKRGEVIGLVGNSGMSTAPHVHYEVYKDDKAVNPIYYFHGDLTAEEYAILLERSALENQSMD